MPNSREVRPPGTVPLIVATFACVAVAFAGFFVRYQAYWDGFGTAMVVGGLLGSFVFGRMVSKHMNETKKNE